VGHLSAAAGLAQEPSGPARSAASPEYEIFAVRYGGLPAFPLRGLIPDAPEGETLDIALAFWFIRSPERRVLFDSGFFREAWLDRFDVTAYVRPDSALARAGIDPGSVTDLVISHAHWDHMGGIELFPNATLWIQDEEYRYYTGPAWREGGRAGGIDADDIRHLLDRNLAGSVRTIEGATAAGGVEFLPGLVAHTGARHTFASQYLEVRGSPTYVLASDNAYLYRNLREIRPGATFLTSDREANRAAVVRMLELAGDTLHVVPGHDALQFERFPEIAPGVVRIKP
jgi:glyoxylase-like metal-dependent hydrolase (beta-lactamase superfamily II)